jgi:ankyrin repeat protein
MKSADPSAAKRRMFKAAKTGDAKAMRAAMDEGADVAALDGNKWTALHEACRYGHAGVIGMLLGAGADPNAPHKDNGFTPLIVALFTPANTAVLRRFAFEPLP